MLYRRLADVVVIVHVVVCVFALGGGLLVFANPWVAVVHIPLVAWVCVASFKGWSCPLTPLENRLRIAAGEDAYNTTFVGRYLLPILAPNAQPDEHRAGVVKACIAIAVLNTVFYVTVLPMLLIEPIEE